MNFVVNITKSPNDSRDILYSNTNKSIPETVDLRNDLLPVRNQGAQGSCFAFASSCMKEYQEKKDYGFNEYLSPQFFYDNRANKYDSIENNDEGMYGRNVMKILQKKGICTEKEYPYGKPSTIEKIPSEIFLSAKKHTIKSYAKIYEIDSLKNSLFENGPCLITFPVYNYSSELWKKSTPEETLKGGHAMTVVGYTNDSFIIRNSWGNNWGFDGYCYYKFTDWNTHWEIWTTIDNKTILTDNDNKENDNKDYNSNIYKLIIIIFSCIGCFSIFQVYF